MKFEILGILDAVRYKIIMFEEEINLIDIVWSFTDIVTLKIAFEWLKFHKIAFLLALIRYLEITS